MKEGGGGGGGVMEERERDKREGRKGRRPLRSGNGEEGSPAGISFQFGPPPSSSSSLPPSSVCMRKIKMADEDDEYAGDDRIWEEEGTDGRTDGRPNFQLAF